MNRRIKKKFDKRDGCKTYLDFRLHRIMKVSEKYMTDDNCMDTFTSRISDELSKYQLSDEIGLRIIHNSILKIY